MQFEHSNQASDEHLTTPSQPEISAGTKKKELVVELQERLGPRNCICGGCCRAELKHAFPQEQNAEVSRGFRDGIYDMVRGDIDAWANEGWDHDTPAFELPSSRHWWHRMRFLVLPAPRPGYVTFITVEAGRRGATEHRLRAWKHELQPQADETGLSMGRCSHFPPGTGKSNYLEHRLFCRITANWSGTLLTTHEIIVDRIGFRPERHLAPGAGRSGRRENIPQVLR